MNPIQRSLSKVTAPEESKRRVKDHLSAHRVRGRSAAPRLIAAFACLLVMLLGAGGLQLWSAPASYISIDVNPSIELALNRFHRVVGVTAYNGDGARVLDSLSLRGQTYGEAIDALFAGPTFQSYLGDGATVVFTVVSDSEAQLRQGLQSGNAFLSCASEYYQADSRCLSEAHENGLSVGKYRVYEELSYYDSSITVADCHEMTIGELQQELDRCSGHGSGHDAQEDHHSGASVPPEQTPGSSVSPSSNGCEQDAGSHGYAHGRH